MNRPAYAVSPVLLVCLAIALIGGIATLAYHAGQGNPPASVTTASPTATPTPVAAVAATPTASPLASATPVATATPTATPDPSANWATYIDKNYSVSFKYPASLGKLRESSLTPQDGPTPFNYDDIAIGTDANNYSAMDIASFTQIRTADGDKASLTSLLGVYNSRSSSLTSPLWLPPSNAAIINFTKPQYIENSAGTFRGIYYYALIAQDDPAFGTGVKEKLDQLVILMTDGTSRTLQIEHRLDAVVGKTDPYSYSSIPCMGSDGKGNSVAETCDLNSQVENDFATTYKYVASTVR